MRLALDRESREIRQRLLNSELREAFRIEQEWAVRPTDLQECLLRHRPTIVHFSGHGSSTGELLLENQTGHAVPVTTNALAGPFRILGRDIRCVMLNACFSEGQAKAIAEHVDCVIGMTTAVADGAAIAFAGAFYQALGYGEHVENAFELGCNQIELFGLKQADVPRLIVREGVRAHDIRLIESEGDGFRRGQRRLRPSVELVDARVDPTLGAPGPTSLEIEFEGIQRVERFPFPAVDFKLVNRGDATAILWQIGVEVTHAELDPTPLLSFFCDVDGLSRAISTEAPRQ